MIPYLYQSSAPTQNALVRHSEDLLCSHKNQACKVLTINLAYMIYSSLHVILALIFGKSLPLVKKKSLKLHYLCILIHETVRQL